ncbi:alpha/beta hydrolase [Microvirga pudoricolor]|uniref:alpha/beta hydrolase n=1 Tax=Microvirga pudoricolor TaxID=2778729 RepID=UPI00194DDDEC|nr:alpha/beta hydrolase [Microvirga pudoricolor]MBM6594188.1 alpha/beta hydrolase [Microvirga pudoricolor]
MVSRQAQMFWNLLRVAPKQVDLPIAQRREAGEHAEDATAEPTGVTYRPAPEVGGFVALPEGPPPPSAILYLFGGGYMLGSPASRRKTAGHLAKACQTRVLVPAYRLAPEHPFPAALDDAVLAYRWLLSQDVKASKVIIAGDSSGGGLAFATALALKRQGLDQPAGIIGLSPWADLTCQGASMDECAERDIECTRVSLLQMAQWYLAGASPAQPLASPVLGDLSGLKSVLCLVGSEEILLDDSVRLVRNAGLAGTDATLHVAPGMQHIYPIWAGAFPEADEAISMIASWARCRLGN